MVSVFAAAAVVALGVGTVAASGAGRAAARRVGGAGMAIGVAEDAAKQPTLAAAKAKMDLARRAGFAAVRVTEIWDRGESAPSRAALTALQNAAAAARLDGLRLMVAIFNDRAANTPLTAGDRSQFTQFAAAIVKAVPGVSDFVVGNEPNNNLFWMPQFNADGSDAAASAYEALLAASYDAIKHIRPSARVFGGALAPRGGDNPAAGKPTHSPTSFITDLGAAYRASGRTAPIIDVFDLHPYEDNSSVPPSFDHPNSTTISVPDYPKLVSLLGRAFDGTAQPGSTLPIVYGEYGVESLVPPAKLPLYTGSEPSTTHPVDEPTQGAYYVQAMKVAYCQPNVVGLMLFHVSDEPSLAGWQSGVYYTDDTPKSSLPIVRQGIAAAAAGALTSCPDTTLPQVTLTSPANGSTVSGVVTLTATAADNVGIDRVEWLVDGNEIGYSAVPPYTFNWQTQATGTQTVTARALDAARNTATSSATVTVANG